MNKYQIETRLKELELQNCSSVWIFLKNQRVWGSYFSQIINNTDMECIQLKQNEIYETIPYSLITEIKYID